MPDIRIDCLHIRLRGVSQAQARRDRNSLGRAIMDHLAREPEIWQAQPNVRHVPAINSGTVTKHQSRGNSSWTQQCAQQISRSVVRQIKGGKSNIT